MRKHYHLGRSRCIHKRGGYLITKVDRNGVPIEGIPPSRSWRHTDNKPLLEPLLGSGHKKIKPLRFKF